MGKKGESLVFGHALERGFPMIRTASYSQTLRTIGQALDLLRLGTFKLIRDGDDYVVHAQTETMAVKEQNPQESGFLSTRSGLRGGYQEVPVKTLASELRFTPADIERLGREGQAKRRLRGRVQRPNSLSHVLRAVGAYIDSKAASLLEISKQDGTVVIQYRTALGQISTVRMSLKRTDSSQAGVHR